MNRPSVRWRSITLLTLVILIRPLCLLWQSIYLEHGQNNSAMLIVVAFILDTFSLFICVILGANRSRTLVAASFVFSVISIAQIPVVYFIAVVVYPLINTPSLMEAAVQFPQLYYCGLFFNNIIITICCLFAARWLRETIQKPPIKLYLFFSLLFLFFALIVLVWWSDIFKIMSISFLSSAFMGMFLLGILLLLFYLYTRLVVNKDTKKDNYSKYIQYLSKRELEVVEAVLAGNDSYKKLTTALNISVSTIKTHLKHIYRATGVSNIAGLSSLFSGYSSKSPINHP